MFDVKLARYALVSVLSMALSSFVSLKFGELKLQRVQASHARILLDIANQAALAEHGQLKKYQQAQKQIEQLDYELFQEQKKNEQLSKDYRARLASGAERLRVAIRKGSAGCHSLRADSSAAKLGDGSTASAELDPAFASRLFKVAEDDQREIDKLKALQEYVLKLKDG